MTHGEILREQVPEDQDIERVDRWVSGRLPDVTRAAVQRWINNGRVLLNGEPCKPKDKVRPGMLVEIRPDQEPATDAQPDPSIVLDVVYEDPHLLVVNKPAGLVVHPGRGHRTGTLVNGLLARSGFERPPSDPQDPEGHLRPGIVHRIDKDTSGLLVVAKDAPTREGLKSQLAKHTVTRSYWAVTLGVPQVGRIATLHGRDPKNRLRFSSKVRDGKEAVTHVSVEEQLANGRAALVLCRLETGRTHQIRVHLSMEANTPLLGDELYGGLRGAQEISDVGKALGRQALHARELGFRHPLTQEELSFEAPLPLELSDTVEALRRLS